MANLSALSIKPSKKLIELSRWRERGDEAEARVRQAEHEKGEVVERMQRNVETLKQVRRHCFFFALEFNPKTNIQGHEQEVELQKAAHCKELSKIQQQLVRIYLLSSQFLEKKN